MSTFFRWKIYFVMCVIAQLKKNHQLLNNITSFFLNQARLRRKCNYNDQVHKFKRYFKFCLLTKYPIYSHSDSDRNQHFILTTQQYESTITTAGHCTIRWLTKHFFFYPWPERALETAKRPIKFFKLTTAWPHVHVYLFPSGRKAVPSFPVLFCVYSSSLRKELMSADSYVSTRMYYKHKTCCNNLSMTFPTLTYIHTHTYEHTLTITGVIVSNRILMFS